MEIPGQMDTFGRRVAVMLAGLLAVSALLQAGPAIQITAVTNAADFKPGLPQKGSIASIFCAGLQGTGIITAPAQYPIATELIAGGLTVKVQINFTAAPILAIAFEPGYQQINIQVPWEARQDPLFVQVFQGSNSAYYVDQNPWVDFPNGDPATVKWSVFFVNPQGYAIIQHISDYSLVTEQNPARPGEYLAAYGISLGPVSNAPASSFPAPVSPLAIAVAPANACRVQDSVQIGGVSTPALYVGLAPGLAGVYQVNFQVPANAPAGDQPLILERTFLINPFGQCLLSGMGSTSWGPYISRPAVLPVE